MSAHRIQAKNGKTAQAGGWRQPSERARRWHVMRLLCRAIAIDSALRSSHYQIGDKWNE
jgi:hypothetical protein